MEDGGDQQDAFYGQLAYCDIADVLRFVNRQCRFLAALKPLQPRYAKQVADEDSLTTVIVAQAMNHGNLLMSRTSDVPYHVLEATYQQHLRLQTLQAANDRTSNAIASLPIFKHYSFDLETLYGAVDGQKFGVKRLTVKASLSRNSAKFTARTIRRCTGIASSSRRDRSTCRRSSTRRRTSTVSSRRWDSRK